MPRPSHFLAFLSLVLALAFLVALDAPIAFALNLPKNLNVPSNAKGIIFLGQGAHLDWDWLNTFPTYASNNPPDHTGYFFNPNPEITPQPTDQVFTLATKYLVNASYQYQVCEMGFLRKFSQDKPNIWAQFRTYAQQGRVSVVGGGITSPDNLLSSGEAFIRNYLAGMSFLRSQNISWSGYIWLPDDFGHDSQLPVLANAIGAKGVSFSRLPNNCQQGPNQVPQGLINAHNLLLDEELGGLEFTWAASDGSETFTYYMPDTYCSGDFLNTPFIECGTPSQCSECARATFVVSTNDHIEAYLNTRQPLTATPFAFTVIGCDFAAPVREKFNATGYYAVIAPFSTYADAVQGFLKQNPKKSSIKQRTFHGTTPQTVFRPSPYWTGFYASRVPLKFYHYETSRALVSSEIFALMLRAMGVATSKLQVSIDGLWDNFSPSTHHDFVTGTALDYVYQTEQLPLSIQNYNASLSLRNSLLTTIVKSLTVQSPSIAVPSVVVFNANGFAAQGPISVDLSATPELREFFAKTHFQETHNGRFVSVASAPSMGFAVQSSKDLLEADSKADSVHVETDADSGDITLQNSFLSVTISPSANWSITSLVDKAQGNVSILASGNALEWRNDGGNIYRYGYEQDCGFDRINVRIVPQSAQILEKGPIRTVVRTSIVVSGKPAPSTKRQSVGCAVCENLIGEVELLLKANATESQIFSFLEAKCILIPGLIGKECKWAIENYGAELINVIEAWETPEVLCDLLSLCPNPKPIDRSFANETYNIEYTLYQNLPYVLINVTGRAARTTAVMSKFTFSDPLGGMYHGTPYHWDSKGIFHYGFQSDFNLTMEATHEFAAPYSLGRRNILGSIFHGSTPAWGVDETTLYGNILRNAPGGTPGCSSYGADGSDTDIHSVTFAFRIPSGLSDPSKGAIQKEARAFVNPLIAVAVQKSLKANVPTSYSMVAVTSPQSSFLTVAKSGTVDPSKVVLRLVNPTTQPDQVELTIDPRLVPTKSMQLISGLETPLGPSQKLGLVEASYAVTTVALN